MLQHVSIRTHKGIELHESSNASKVAYKVVIYRRAVYKDGHVGIKLIAATTKVLPLKVQTPPGIAGSYYFSST